MELKTLWQREKLLIIQKITIDGNDVNNAQPTHAYRLNIFPYIENMQPTTFKTSGQKHRTSP